jgi:hypothetical protein
MAGEEKFFFRKAVQHLARCLAAIKETPWEKVNLNFGRNNVVTHDNSLQSFKKFGLFLTRLELTHVIRGL